MSSADASVAPFVIAAGVLLQAVQVVESARTLGWRIGSVVLLALSGWWCWRVFTATVPSSLEGVQHRNPRYPGWRPRAIALGLVVVTAVSAGYAGWVTVRRPAPIGFDIRVRNSASQDLELHASGYFNVHVRAANGFFYPRTTGVVRVEPKAGGEVLKVPPETEVWATARLSPQWALEEYLEIGGASLQVVFYVSEGEAERARTITAWLELSRENLSKRFVALDYPQEN